MRPWLPWLVLTLTGLVAASRMAVRIAAEPRYGGKPIDHWLTQAVDRQYSKRAEAERVLAHVGPEALPGLVRALRTTDTLPGWVWETLERRLANRVPPPADRVAIRIRAATALACLGPAAAPAAPALVERLGDDAPAVAAAAARALTRMGPPAVIPLTAGLRNPSRAVRERAAEGLAEPGLPGPFPDETHVALRRALRDPEAGVRRQAATAFAHLRPLAPEDLAALRQALSDPRPIVRESAALALGQMGTAARSAAIDLGDRLNDVDSKVRLASALARWRIDGDSDLVVPVMIPLLDEAETRWQAALALREIGPPAARLAVPALLERLQVEVVHRPSRTPATAALALGRMGAAAIPGLRQLLHADDSGVRIGALRALIEQGSSAAPALPDLQQLVDHPDAEVRIVAIEALGAVGPQARPALPRLTEVARESEDYLRATTLTAILRIQGNNPASSSAHN